MINSNNDLSITDNQQNEYIIDSSVIESASQCNKNHHCVSGNTDYSLNSTVPKVVANKILFVECKEDVCPYLVRFGYSAICNCPVRFAIYRKYKK